MLVAARRSRGGPAPAVGGADVRPASARVLRARRPRRRACRPLRDEARGVSRASASRARYVARFDARLAALDAEAFIDDVLVRAARRALGAGRRGFPLRQGPRRRPRDAARACADVQRRRRCARSTSTASARRRPRCAKRSRAGDLDARDARCSAARTRSRGASRTARSSGARSAFPTANCRCGASRRCRASSRCACTASAARRAPASRASACGRRSQRDGKPLLEVFVFDFDEPIYGRRSRVEFLHKLRDEERYPDLDALDAPDPRRRGAGPRVLRAAQRAPDAQRSRPCPTTPKPTTRRTLNLPDTPFPMRGDLAQARARLGRGLAAERRSTRRSAPRAQGRPRFVLHDGPPYANGDIHIGHARQQDPEGHRRQEQDAWPASTRRTCRAGIATACRSRCRSRRRTASTCPAAETQRLARAYATEQIARQSEQFKRLGVLGDWDHPYTTMAFKNEADEIRTLGKVLREGLPLSRPEARQLVLRLRQRARRSRSRVRGSRRHRDRRRRSRSTTPSARSSRRRSACAALPDGPTCFAVIWTTTPWTIPANQALNVHPEFDYALVATPRGHLVLAQDLVEACLARYKLEGTVVATAQGRGARAHRVPPSVLRPRRRRCTSATT